MKRAPHILAACLAMLTLFTGCTTTTSSNQPAGEPLYVGVTANYPPLIARDGEKFVGLDADLARRVAKGLDRPLYFIETKWEQQIPALLKGDVDIIMSGMSITEPRKVRIAFSEPYLETGLVAMMRRKDVDKYTADTIKNEILRISYVKGTTGEKFVVENFPKASKRGYTMGKDAAADLIRNRVDVFIHDGPAVAWLVSANESELAVMYHLWTRDDLGWGMRHGDTELLSDVNRLLAGWKEDGTLSRDVLHWLPYRKQFQ
jgi:ABC-type amino acid transport substrate-binding protein